VEIGVKRKIMKKLHIIMGITLLSLSGLTVANPVCLLGDQSPVCVSNESLTVLKACHWISGE